MANLYDKASIILTANAYSSSKLFSIKPTNGTGDLTFTRASSGSRINSNNLIELVGNNVPRLAYSGSSCPQFLFEPTRTNLLINSSDVTAAGWNYLRISASNTANSTPFNGLTSKKLEVSGSLGAVRCNQAALFGLPTGSIYSFKQYIKKGNIDTVSTLICDNGETIAGTINYTFSTNTFSGTTPGVGYIVSRSSTILSDGWVLINAIVKVTGSSATNSLKVNSFLPGTDAFGGSIGDSIFVSNAQLELGRYPTSDIITAGATVTRIEDSSGILGTTGLSSLIGQREGTLFIDYTPTFLAVNNANNGPGILKINNTINGTLTIAQNGSDNIQAVVYSGSTIPTSTAVSLLSNGPVNLSSSYKIAFAYSSSNSKLYINGIQNGTSTAIYNTFNTTLDSLYLTDSGFSGTVNQNLFKTVAIYKTRLTDSELIALTT